MVYPHVEYRGPAHLDLLDAPGSAMPRELDSRVNNGIHVRLLWHPTDSHLSVAVHDTRTDKGFELAVGEGVRARDVFHHPYAYAAGRRAPATPSGPAADVAVGVRAAV
jgi:hypothetical protein